MLYDSQIKKILKINTQENQNTIDTQDINKTNLILNPENFVKDTVVLPLIVGYDFRHGVFDPHANNGKGGYINSIVLITTGGPNEVGVFPIGPTFAPVLMTYFANLPNFPEWAIPMTKIIPRVYIDDAYDISTVTFSVSCRHYWLVKGNSITLKVIVFALSSATNFGQIPTYLDMDLVFFNELVTRTINLNKD